MTDCPKPKPKPWELPYLYILMREDLGGSGGKIGAQTAHAANKLETLVKKTEKAGIFEARPIEEHPAELIIEVTDPLSDRQRESLQLFDEWKESSGQGFGTTIVLAVPNFQTLAKVITAAKEQDFFSDTVFDESYPVPDPSGKFTHLVPCTTCGFIFGRKGQLAVLTERFPLL